MCLLLLLWWLQQVLRTLVQLLLHVCKCGRCTWQHLCKQWLQHVVGGEGSQGVQEGCVRLWAFICEVCCSCMLCVLV